MNRTVLFNGIEYDARHGGPFDRGSADSYYGRACDPHYYIGRTGLGLRVDFEDLSDNEIKAYNAGYEYNEQFGDKKEYE